MITVIKICELITCDILTDIITKGEHYPFLKVYLKA